MNDNSSQLIKKPADTVLRSKVPLVLRVAAVLLVVSGTAAGLFARSYKLGARPLAVDEYYFVSSVELILKHGVPRFEAGGYYWRGILPQYLTASSARIFGKNGFAYRLPAVAFSLGAVILSYFYARRFVNGWIALVIPLMLLVSSWQIEFARFARMYSAFQCFTALLLIAVGAAYFDRKWPLRYLPFIAVILTILSHEMAILLVPCLLLPLLPDRPRDGFSTTSHRAACVIMTVVAACLWKFLTTYGYYGDALPEGVVAPASALLRTPAFPFWSFGAGPLVDLASACGMGLAVVLVLGGWKLWGGRISVPDILCAVIVTATILHQFVVALAGVAILVLRYDVHRPGEHRRRLYVVLGIAGAIGIAWCAYALSSTSWWARVDSGEFGLRWCVRRTFFGWPDFYTPLALQWAIELPLLGAAALAAVLHQLATKLRGPWQGMLRSPACVVIYVALCLGVLHSQYVTTRYHFFIYPVILTTILVSLVEIGQQVARRDWVSRQTAGLASAVVCLGLFVLSADFSIGHIANVAQPTVGYRIGEFQRFAPTWYNRYDYESPARYVNRSAPTEADSRVLVVSAPPVSYYLSGSHAIYYGRDDSRFYGVSRKRGTVDQWSNRRLLSTVDDVREYTRDARVIWIIKPAAGGRWLQPEQVWRPELARISRTFLSEDRRIEVVKVQKQLVEESGQSVTGRPHLR